MRHSDYVTSDHHAYVYIICMSVLTYARPRSTERALVRARCLDCCHLVFSSFFVSQIPLLDTIDYVTVTHNNSDIRSFSSLTPPPTEYTHEPKEKKQIRTTKSNAYTHQTWIGSNEARDSKIYSHNSTNSRIKGIWYEFSWMGLEIASRWDR